jgi:hypothetical protein
VIGGDGVIVVRLWCLWCCGVEVQGGGRMLACWVPDPAVPRASVAVAPWPPMLREPRRAAPGRDDERLRNGGASGMSGEIARPQEVRPPGENRERDARAQ